MCEGKYPHHLQGLAGDAVACLYWSFTDILVKTNLKGEVLARVDVPTHNGDLCYADGKVYVAWADYFNKPRA